MGLIYNYCISLHYIGHGVVMMKKIETTVQYSGQQWNRKGGAQISQFSHLVGDCVNSLLADDLNNAGRRPAMRESNYIPLYEKRGVV